MIGLIFIGIGILFLVSMIKIPLLIITGPQGWQIKIPGGFVFIFIGIYLDYGASIIKILGL